MPEDIKQLEAELEEIEQTEEASNLEWAFKNALMEYKGEDRVVSFTDYLKLTKSKKELCFASGIKKLDDLIGGFHPCDLITITAPTGQGKTSFCQFLTSKFAEVEQKSLWFSYEVSTYKLIEKFGANLPEGYTPLVLESKNMTWLERKIVEGIVKHKISVVFIDHLHYLFNMDMSRNTSMDIGQIMRDLKIIAKKYKITIFIVAHTMKVFPDDIVDISSIRDSSFIGQESDCVIALWRGRTDQKKKDLIKEGLIYTNEAIINVCKNRYNGRIGSFKMLYEVENNQYLESL